MIGVLHGYSLEGSGSNIWTRYMVQALCREGELVHLICQEKSPEKYDFIAEAYDYADDCAAKTVFKRDIPYPGRCIFYRPQLGSVLPVYVGRFLESNPPMLPMNELPNELIQDYLDRNHQIIREIVERQNIRVIHVNHAVLMSAVAQRLYEDQSIPFAVMPHGSEIEYVIRKDGRFLNLAEDALMKAGLIFVLSRELQQRILSIFFTRPEFAAKMVQLNLGVDTTLFEPSSRTLRRSRMENVFHSIASATNGKDPEMTKQMLGLVEQENPISLSRMQELIDGARRYAGRQPDEDLEKKLSLVDWENEDIILYAGRLITAKGIHLLISALPLIFESRPSARLVIAGHGPLREVMEVFLWALQNEKIELIEQILRWGRALEGGAAKPFHAILKFHEDLRNQSKLQQYYETARRVLRPDQVLFTGYLRHEQLRHLFSCSDVAVFPSMIPEAGPLVFLEALASGCFPIATYFGGAAYHIDLVDRYLESSDAAEWMKIRPQEEFSVTDIVGHVSAALQLRGKYQNQLRQIAVQNFDWLNVARKWKNELFSLAKS